MRRVTFWGLVCLAASLLAGQSAATAGEGTPPGKSGLKAIFAKYESESDAEEDRDWLNGAGEDQVADGDESPADERDIDREDAPASRARKPAAFRHNSASDSGDDDTGDAAKKIDGELVDPLLLSDDCCDTDDCCDSCGSGGCGRTPWRWSGLYGDFLWLQARNASVPFAVPQNGIGFAGAAPNGPVGSVIPVPRAGFRVGGAMMIGCASRLTASYTWFESHTGANVTVPPGGVVNPLTMFPGTFNAGFSAERSSAAHDLAFQLADTNYETLFINSDRRWIGLMGGAVYGQLRQDFWALYPFSPPDGPTRVGTRVDFYGAGIQLGLEGEQRVWQGRGFCVYGRGMSRFLSGQFRSSYLQTNEFNGVEATVAIKDARIVPLLDLELGVSWISPSARFRLYGGYMVNSWFNSISTASWIGSVQNSTFLPGSHAITFDGLVARAQIAF
ncbi:MAG: hypothetical protein K2Y37_01610 [Pirellulales bacterium]|nr:hypothetical protein [Pirellulales bacterium]